MNTSSRIARQLLALSNTEYSLSRGGKGQKGDAGRSQQKQEIVLPSKMTQQELAEMVGCSREQVNCILKKFVQEKAISKSVDKPWVILDCEKLKRHAQ